MLATKIPAVPTTSTQEWSGPNVNSAKLGKPALQWYVLRLVYTNQSEAEHRIIIRASSVGSLLNRDITSITATGFDDS